MTDNRKPTSVPHFEPWFPDYSFLHETAAVAREQSRRYWQKDGEADRKHPVQRNPGWYEKKKPESGDLP